MAGIHFGTDGWRAIIGWDFTADNVRACAMGVATYLQKSGMAFRGLIVGYDTRFASEDFAAEVARVTTAAGVPTFLCDRATPTPVASYNIVHLQAGGGVVITASHNPPQWNGFKYKPDYGGSASPEVVKAWRRRSRLPSRPRSPGSPSTRPVSGGFSLTSTPRRHTSPSSVGWLTFQLFATAV